jgi:hypothetical protein
MAPAAAPKGLDLPQAGSDVSRTTNALDPSIIERMGLSQPAVSRTTNALDPSIIERMGLSQPAAQQPVNALAPTPAPTSNALAPAAPAQMDEVAKLEADIAMLSASRDPRAVALIGRLEKRLEELTKSQVVAPGGTVLRGGKVVYTAPAAPGTPSQLARLMSEMNALPPSDPRRAMYQSIINKEITHAPQAQGATVKINTQLPASEEAQKEFMKEMRQTFSALKQAPTVLSNMEAAKKLFPADKGFMGPGGEPLLKAASFLNNRLGTNIDTKGVENAEELRSRLFFGILDNLKKLDSQPTQQQQDTLRVALGSIGTDPTALPRVLDAFGNSIREKVDLYNQEVTGAEERGVKFPYKPTITLKPTTAGKDAPTTAGAYTDAAKEAR